MASRLSDCLVRDGTLREDVVRAALARQAVYGGTLDTALLELGAIDEPTLWSALAIATGAPVPDAGMFENPDPTAAATFDVSWSRRCRAVPVGTFDGLVQLCCSEPVGEAELAAARAALGLSFEIYVVPEVRLAAARQAVYGEPMSPRLLRVLARLLGAQPVRKWVKALAPEVAPPAASGPDANGTFSPLAEGELAEAEFDVPLNTYPTEAADIIESRASRTYATAAADEVARALAGSDEAPAAAPAPAPAEVPAPAPRPSARTPLGRPSLEASGALPPSDGDEDALCLVADDPESDARLAALRVLRTRLNRPRVRALANKLCSDLMDKAERSVLAAGALGELRDAQAVPDLIDVLEGPQALARTAARALVEITQQDFGRNRKKWLAWWAEHKGEGRVAWLLEGLSHRAPEIRFASSEELRLITGEYFGYHFDLPKREREEARARWQAWCEQNGATRGPDTRSPTRS
jgi:hypothetical protein